MVVAIIAVLVAILLPSLASARVQMRMVSCKSNLKQMGIGLALYANEWNDFMMPLGYGPQQLFWWGQRIGADGEPASEGRVDHSKGFLWPYLRGGQYEDDVFACPALPAGKYTDPESTPGEITSAYGYNGYYLSPPATPVWEWDIASKPWQKITTVQSPSLVFSFADAAIDMDPNLPMLTAYLDPPFTYRRSGMWIKNSSPTTHFRHQRRADVLCVDGHSTSFSVEEGGLGTTARAETFLIGYVGNGNHPHYVPDDPAW